MAIFQLCCNLEVNEVRKYLMCRWIYSLLKICSGKCQIFSFCYTDHSALINEVRKYLMNRWIWPLLLKIVKKVKKISSKAKGKKDKSSFLALIDCKALQSCFFKCWIHCLEVKRPVNCRNIAVLGGLLYVTFAAKY